MADIKTQELPIFVFILPLILPFFEKGEKLSSFIFIITLLFYIF